MDDSEVVKKGAGSTQAERYVARLCERTFLSMWSYPNVYRDVHAPGTTIGKEVCDLLVLFGDHVLIFADKDCAVGRSGNLDLDWQRWFRRAVLSNARQLHGAERWIRQFPERLFLDPTCQRRVPIAPPIAAATHFHLIVVAHNIAERCMKELGGSGSLMIWSDLQGDAAHGIPFTVGDVNPAQSFVHVLDDTTLPVLLDELDTIADFVAYLNRKVSFLRGAVKCHAAGEEELLAWYLQHANSAGQHDFCLPEEDVHGLALFEGIYADYLEHPQRKAKVQADRVSFSWDKLIERFSFHAMNRTQHESGTSSVSDAERIVRVMAAEPRTRRRMLARKLVECVAGTPGDQRRLAVAPPQKIGEPCYCFLMMPWNENWSERKNREFRKHYLIGACRVVRLRFPEAVEVLGIATEAGNDHEGRSEDAVLCDFRDWGSEDEELAREFEEKTGVLTKATVSRGVESEYPDIEVPMLPGRSRNAPCPCGSGKKYKKCHGAR